MHLRCHLFIGHTFQYEYPVSIFHELLRNSTKISDSILEHKPKPIEDRKVLMYFSVKNSILHLGWDQNQTSRVNVKQQTSQSLYVLLLKPEEFFHLSQQENESDHYILMLMKDIVASILILFSNVTCLRTCMFQSRTGFTCCAEQGKNMDSF